MLDAITDRLFAGASALRRKRIVHPHGIGFEAELTVAPAPGVLEVSATSLLSAPGAHRATVRLSRGAGLPTALPDVLGLAIRIDDAYGAGRHQDFLLASSGAGPLLHHLLLPSRRGYLAVPYSSVLPYRLGDSLRILGARPDVAVPGVRSTEELRRAAGRGLSFRLALAPSLGRWREVATLTVGKELAAAEVEQIRFNPFNIGGGFELAGPLMRIRGPAYRGSQRGRLASGG